ncbi:MAG: DNA polymerase III subunit alpha, partial [Clostridia bacterium]
AVRDAGRALGVAADVVDAAARLIPQRPDVTLESALAEVAALAPALGVGGPDWLPVARAIEGAPRHASTHAAGVVVAPGPIGAWSPLQADASVTTLPMGDLDRLGLLKLDLLGLRTLSVVREVRARIAESVPELPDVPRDDPETLSLLGHGETEGIFQLDGRGVKELLADLKPASVADIMLTVALFRPGPMDHIRDYLRERRERTLAPLETGSVLVFQEQLMALVRETAGYSWAEADLFRRAVSKKDRALLASERDRFLSRAAARVGMREAQELWPRIEAFADYGFNKAHAACYGFLAYYMAYLKTHHPYAFWAGEWATRGHGESLGRAIAAAFREGVAPLSPHVNRSQPGPSAEEQGGGVRLGLAAVRGVGSELAQRVVAEREANGLYTSVTDLARRVAAIERALPTLWHADALRDLEGAERVPDPGRTRSGQLSLFDDVPVAAAESVVNPDPLEAFGWHWPQSDGAVYLRVTRFADVDQDGVRQAASRFPGQETVVAAESGSRSGRRLPVAVSGTVWALRALRGVPGVKNAMRGLLMPAKESRDES